VLAIIMILAALAFVNLGQSRNDQNRIRTEMRTFQSVFEKARSMSLGQERRLNPSTEALEIPVGGYGIHIAKAGSGLTRVYYLFADFDNDGFQPDDVQETYVLRHSAMRMPDYPDFTSVNMMIPIASQGFDMRLTESDGVESSTVVLDQLQIEFYTDRSESIFGGGASGFVSLYAQNGSIQTDI
jgi:type II secretory pathway pseudopilin PulG